MAVLIICSVILQTVINLKMLPIGGQGALISGDSIAMYALCTSFLYIPKSINPKKHWIDRWWIFVVVTVNA